MSENEKRMILNDLHAELSTGTKPSYSKLKFKTAVSLALSVCIISSALTYSQYAGRHNIPVQTETDKSTVTNESLCQTDIINSDTITVNTDVPQSSETYSYDDYDYTEISESRISDTEKSSETQSESGISETHDSINTSRETDSTLTVTIKTEETANTIQETTTHFYIDNDVTANETSDFDSITYYPETTTICYYPETTAICYYPETTTIHDYPETTSGQVTTTGETTTIVPEPTNTEATTTTTSETTVPATESDYFQPSVSQPPEETY